MDAVAAFSTSTSSLFPFEALAMVRTFVAAALKAKVSEDIEGNSLSCDSMKLFYTADTITRVRLNRNSK